MNQMVGLKYGIDAYSNVIPRCDSLIRHVNDAVRARFDKAPNGARQINGVSWTPDLILHNTRHDPPLCTFRHGTGEGSTADTKQPLRADDQESDTARLYSRLSREFASPIGVYGICRGGFAVWCLKSAIKYVICAEVD